MINFASWFTISKAHGWGGHSQNARLHSTITSFWAHYFGDAIILGLYSPPKYPHLGKGRIILCNMISKYTKKILTCFLQTTNTQSWSSSFSLSLSLSLSLKCFLVYMLVLSENRRGQRGLGHAWPMSHKKVFPKSLGFWFRVCCSCVEVMPAISVADRCC
jgi:hypothetical protein